MNFTSSLDRIRRCLAVTRGVVAWGCFVSLASLLNSCAQPAYLAIPKATPGLSNEEETELAFKMEEAADLTVFYTRDNKIEIETGRERPLDPRIVAAWGNSGPMTYREKAAYAPASLKDHFDMQPKKDLLVILFHKSNRSPAENKAEVAHLNDYFAARGYRRIIIQQLLTFGRPIYSDILAIPS